MRTSYIADNFGRPSHYYDQLPFSESMVEHNQNSYYKNGYKFNGKELDEATGMYYYGARYYDPRLSIFISVDPLVKQFAGWTPYHYVHNNPINLIDPTGMSADGWRRDLQTGEMSYDDSFTSENTEPLKYEYSDGGWDDKYIYETNGTKTMTDEYLYDLAFGLSKENKSISTLGRGNGNGNANISLLNDNMIDALKYDHHKDYKILVTV